MSSRSKRAYLEDENIDGLSTRDVDDESDVDEEALMDSVDKEDGNDALKNLYTLHEGSDATLTNLLTSPRVEENGNINDISALMDR